MTDSVNTCRYCGTQSPSVDCYGIYACPNKFCLATGAWNKRLEAKYQDGEGNQTDAQVVKMLQDLREEKAACEARLKVLKGCELKLLVCRSYTLEEPQALEQATLEEPKP